jgi:hypothetical protein
MRIGQSALCLICILVAVFYCQMEGYSMPLILKNGDAYARRVLYNGVVPDRSGHNSHRLAGAGQLFSQQMQDEG